MVVPDIRPGVTGRQAKSPQIRRADGRAAPYGRTARGGYIRAIKTPKYA